MKYLRKKLIQFKQWILSIVIGRYYSEKRELFRLKTGKRVSKFSIEYYPLTSRYYPKYGKYYLQKDFRTGIVDLNEAFLFSYADYGRTEQEADEIIELFKEQQLKENVKTLPVKN